MSGARTGSPWSFSALIIAAMIGGGCGGEAPAPPSLSPTGERAIAARDSSLSENGIPEILELRIFPQEAQPGDTLRAEARAEDPDGDPMTIQYAWRVPGSEQRGRGPEFKPSRLKKGMRVEVSAIARDPFGESAPRTASLRLRNSPPKIHALEFRPKGEIRGDRDLAVHPRASDPDGDRLRYRYEWFVNGSRSEAGGALLPRQEFRRGDSVQLRLVVTDGQGGRDEFQTNPLPVANAAPSIISQPGGISGDGVFRYGIEVEDADLDRPLQYTLVEGPRNMRLDTRKGELNWRPGRGDIGQHRVHIRVADGHGGSASQEFTLAFDLEVIGQN